MTDKQKNWIRNIDKFVEANSENWVRFDDEEVRQVFPELFSPMVKKYRLKMDVMGFEKGTIWIVIDGKDICYKDYKFPLKNFSNFMVYFEEVHDGCEMIDVKDINLPEGASENVFGKPAPITGTLHTKVTSASTQPFPIVEVKRRILTVDGSIGLFRAQGNIEITSFGDAAFHKRTEHQLNSLDGVMEVKLISK